MAGGFGPPMDAANGTPIRTYGTRYVKVCFGNRRFSWDFAMAKVSVPLLGADFLCAYGLLVDVKNCCLIEAVTFSSYPCTLGGAGPTGLSNMLAAGDDFLHLLTEFPDLTTPTFSSAVAKHGVEHCIQSMAAPGASTQPSSPLLRRSSGPWSALELFASPTARQPHPSIWSRRLMAVGARAGITDVSTMSRRSTVTRSHIFRIFPPVWRGK